MEYQKNFGDKFSIGYGTSRTVGKGNLAEAEEVPKSMKYRHDRREILKTAAKASFLTLAAVLNFGYKRRRKKKK